MDFVMNNLVIALSSAEAALALLLVTISRHH
jgi:hypothetical protein